MKPVDRILARLESVRERNGYWQARCSAHEDPRPSLSIKEGDDGRALVTCHAGCETEAVMKALGLEMKDLFERRNGHRSIVDSYPYTDANGELLFEVVRFDPKGFAQRRPNGSGEWRWGLENVEPVLYRLPAIRSAVESGNTIYVVEGEKDADRLTTLGLTATTNPMGAGKWRDSYSDALCRAHVVILPDNDDPGRKHTNDIAAKLQGRARSVKIVDLPGLDNKEDVSDWLDSGSGADDLVRLTRETPEWVEAPKHGVAGHGGSEIFTAAELMSEELPCVRWAVPEILPEGVNILGSKAKVGKSWLMLGLGVAVASGGIALGTRQVEQGEVLYLALEDNLRRLQRRLGMMLADRNAPDGLHLALTWPRLDDGGVDKMDDFLQRRPRTRLVVVDTLKKVRPRVFGNRSVYDVDYEALEPLVPLAAEHGVAIVLVHHTRKLPASDPLDELSGSTGLSAGADGVLILKRERGRADAFLHVTGREIEEEKELALRWDADTTGWRILGDADEYRLSEERVEVLRILEDMAGWMTPTEVADALGESTNTIKMRMWRMAGDGQLQSKGGKYAPCNLSNPVTE